MALDGDLGDLSVRQYEASSFLSKPIPLTDSLKVIPMFAYGITQLNFSIPSALPIEEESLHSASLSAIFLENFGNSPWLAVAWMRAELATDYQGIAAEDLTFDVSLGLSYRFSDAFTLGVGFVITNLNGREQIFPGLNFNWQPNEKLAIGNVGPNLFIRYVVNDSWFLSTEGTPGGGNWNINDAAGQSRTLELDSYWISLNTNHRIYRSLWLSAGIGYTLGNEISIHGNHTGSPSFSREMQGAPMAQISLSLATW